MKMYRKNRSQQAKSFVIGGKMIFGFLVMDDGKHQMIETLTGKRIKFAPSKDGGITEDKYIETTTDEERVSGWKTFTRKDGSKYSIMYNNRM